MSVSNLELPINHVNGFEMPRTPIDNIVVPQVALRTPRPIVIRSVLDYDDPKLERLEQLGIGSVEEPIVRHSLRFILPVEGTTEGEEQLPSPIVEATIAPSYHNFLKRITFKGMGYCVRKLRADNDQTAPRPISSLLEIHGSFMPDTSGIIGKMTVKRKSIQS